MNEPASSERLARLRAEAEAEMRRHLPDDDGQDGRPAKRPRGADGADAGASRRFDYGAAAELEAGSLSGFLLTCPIQRENSARKEAVPLLERYLRQCRGGDAVPAPAAIEGSGGEGGEGDAADAADTQQQEQPQQQALAAVKVACRGLVAFKLGAHPSPGSSGAAADAALVHRVVAALLADVASGKQPRLQQVQRIVPVQATCKLEAVALRDAGAALAALVVAAAAPPSASAEAAAEEQQEKQQRGLTFGIAVKQREAAGPKLAASSAAAAAGDGDGKAAGGSEAAAPAAEPGSGGALGRGAIIASLAAGFERALRERHGVAAAVDLKKPDWVLVVETLPTGGGGLFACLCALPAALCALKPKLHVLPVGRC